tara:strand:+ start:10845 stop:11174 length:330 start_codon:yes stop_codon:yes gene_type:complete
MIDIKLLRKQKKISQKDWGELLGGVNPPYISEVENGKRPIPGKWKTILAEKFDIDPDKITNSYKPGFNRSEEDELLIQELRNRIKAQESLMQTMQKAIDALTADKNKKR